MRSNGPPSESARAVAAALTANLLLALAKGTAFLLTGSASMLSEAVHSTADTANQVLLAIGIARSTRPADPQHPYGYGAARYVWSMLSASALFFIGCGATVWHGVTALMDPQPLTDLRLAFAVLAIAATLDGTSLLFALRAVWRSARDDGVSTWSYITRGDDPAAVHVLAEDSTALVGLLLAAGALGMYQLTGDPRYDAAGSVAIGLLMGVSAAFLIDRNRRLLLQRAAPEPQRARFLAVLRASPFVEEVTDVKATVLGPDAVRFKAEVEFDGHALAREHLATLDLAALRRRLDSREALERFLGDYADHIVERLGDEVDRLEGEVHRQVPETAHVDLETS